MGETTRLPMYRYTVQYGNGSEGGAVASVEASYIQEEGSLLMFKDANHAVVFAVMLHALGAVQREGLVTAHERTEVHE
jgi:hypothetical protein